MLPDDDTCYRAMVARDGRFDGRFFVGVMTTGVYCRPVCPARTPLRRNVRFYATAATAAAAGLRPCKRCRPDALPGSRDWDHQGDLVSRALRLIGSGRVDGGGVGGMADELAVSERHLRRVLVAELGVGPLELARTRRAQTARMLIDQTAMPLTDVSFAAGFASIRQFNDVMRAEFGMAPRDLRRSLGDEAPDRRPTGTATVVLRLRFREPYARTDVLGWIGRHAVPGLVEVAGDRVSTRLGGGDQVTCAFGPGAVVAELHCDDVATIPAGVAAIRSWLDLDAVPLAVDDHLRRSPVFEPLVARRPGMRVVGSPDPFRAAVLAVLAQQVSLAAARRLGQRLCAGSPQPGRIPTPDELASGDPVALARELGTPVSRAATLVALARGAANGAIDLTPHADREATLAALARIRGIGPWTLADIRMRALGDPDVWPHNDLVLRRFVPADPVECSPWRSYAAHHVWCEHASRRLAVSQTGGRRDAPPGELPAALRDPVHGTGRQHAEDRPASSSNGHVQEPSGPTGTKQVNA